MKTQLIKVDNNNIDVKKINSAAKILRDGGTVAFPTETVYGLGANIFNESAVKRIFEAKGRPSDNPLIVHISKVDQMKSIVKNINKKTLTIMENFWPGPLTLILYKNSQIPDIITAGLDTVAVRYPSHPVAKKLIEYANIPVAAPSANISGKPSPTKAKHVIDDLMGKVDVIVDGGNCEVGLESTVLDMTSDTPIILRPGGITYEQIVQKIGRVEIAGGDNEDINFTPKAPGMKYKHYAPDAKLTVVEGDFNDVITKINELTKKELESGKKVAVMCLEEAKDMIEADRIYVLGNNKSLNLAAFNLFSYLRKFDEDKIDTVFVQAVDKAGIGMALRNRIDKAAAYNIISV